MAHQSGWSVLIYGRISVSWKLSGKPVSSRIRSGLDCTSGCPSWKNRGKVMGKGFYAQLDIREKIYDESGKLLMLLVMYQLLGGFTAKARGKYREPLRLIT